MKREELKHLPVISGLAGQSEFEAADIIYRVGTNGGDEIVGDSVSVYGIISSAGSDELAFFSSARNQGYAVKLEALFSYKPCFRK